MLQALKKFNNNFKLPGCVDYIVAGLGNPGYKYINTRHNIGFKTIDFIAEHIENKKVFNKFNAKILDTVIAEKRVILLKPQTFMNASGEAVKAAMDFYKVDINNVIVIFDDISLPLGKIRIRKKGSAGGHNGIKSIINITGKNDFPRIKIGIGSKPSEDWDLADWVLSKFKDDEIPILNKAIENAYLASILMFNNNIQEAMNKFNG